MTTVLTLDAVQKTYPGTAAPALKETSLSFEGGQFITLLGPSGCGKSTTLRMVGGFEHPDSGRIRILGQDCTDLPPHKRNVNIVFQDYGLFPHLNVRRNIAFSLELKGLPKTEIDDCVDEMLRLVKLEPFAERMPSELSGGQRQRVALARALAPDPPILLLDEPLSALDAKLRREMQVELRRLQRETGKTFILVTHDQEEALTMSDLVIVMNHGEVVQTGTPWELYNAPANEFVARFIGEMNFLPSTVTGLREDHVMLDWAGARLAGQAASDMPAPDAACVLAIRPEHITLHASQPPAGDVNAVRGHVAERIFRGSNVNYIVHSNGIDISVSAPQRTLRDDENDVWMTWETAHALVLAAPAETAEA